MGVLVNGVWTNEDSNEKSKSGDFIRKDSKYRNWIYPEKPLTSNNSQEFISEKNRYVLYVSYACPWAHRTIIYRAILGLEKVIDVCVVNPVYNATGWSQEGWSFQEYSDVSGDHINGKKHLHEIYTLSKKDYSGKVTVPVLWDKKSNTIVNNESADIIKILNFSFKDFCTNWIDLYPEKLKTEIDDLNEYIYSNLNNGVYRTGFASSQNAYENGVKNIFLSLEKIEKLLENKNYLFGDTPLETDWRLFTTLIRFDPVYYYHFKCNTKKLKSFKNIQKYINNLSNYPKIINTIKLNHIIDHYYLSHLKINPYGIIPIGAPKSFQEIFN